VPRRKKLAGPAAFLVLALLAAMFGAMCGLMLIYSVDLPQMQDLERYRPSATTELYDIHGNVIGSFALERRVVIRYEDIPPILRQAVISIEDKNFESHWGVNLFRVAGAAYRDLTQDSRAQGASTLTMQLARNLFLSPDRTFRRKLQEVFLSIQIERNFTKEQIFTLYANQIYLGQGVYGFEAGSEYYFSKPARQLTLPEAALLAALPRGPSYYSPVNNPERAFRRRNRVLNAMLEDGVITQQQAEAAKASPLGLHIEPPPNTVAPWFVEEVRKELDKRFGPDMVHQGGLRVYTTLDLPLQLAANQAVLDGLAAYEHRHGWKGQLLNVIAGGSSLEAFHHPDWGIPLTPGTYIHGLVTEVLPYEVTVRVGKQNALIDSDGWAWTGHKTATDFLHVGDIVYVQIQPSKDANSNVLRAILEQDSGVQGALLAVDNASGEVMAMVGGRDFNMSQYNRATEAQRQTGSSFKAYVYTAAIEAGEKPDSLVLDSPVTFPSPSGPYTPHNYDDRYQGEITLLHAFADSRNIPALKIADRVGIHKVIETAHQFGITTNIPPFLPIALGSAEVSLYEQVAAYSSFPNDGIRITPHFIRRVANEDDETLYEATPDVHISTDQKSARLMMQLLEAVITQGTGRRAGELHHPLGGKTGTTSNFTDAWFMGFSPSYTCGVWVGYDSRESLGKREEGARAALPIWIQFMRAAIVGHPNETFPGESPATTPAQPNGTSPAASPAVKTPTATAKPAMP
jgi:penicillin-binding protein 1A